MVYGVNAPVLTLAIWRLARGAARGPCERPLKPTPWRDTLCDLDVWESMRATVVSVRPLTPAEAAMDCRALARGGLLPPRAELAARWRWDGPAGVARARRLAESLEWLDLGIAKWNGL